MHVRTISPLIVQRKWVKGVCLEEKHHYLPGYIFVYTDHEPGRRLWVDGVIRVLNNGPLHGDDMRFAMMLYNCDGVIGNVKVYQVGEKLTIANGPLSGFQG